MQEKKRIIPKYAYIPLLCAVLLNTIVYNGSKLISNHLHHFDFSIIIDAYIPFCSLFILIYILAYLHWIIGYIIISRENSYTCYSILSAEIIAKFICLFFFLVLPTTIVRPEVSSDGILSFFTRFIYAMDEPVNLFPSIHCLESWMVFRGSIHLKKVSKSYKWVMFVCAVLVCMSTVFVKQHVFVDIIGGILAVEISLFIVHKWKIGIFFEKINVKFKK